MLAFRALALISAVGVAAPAWAQMPSGIVGGTNLLQESSRPVTGTAGSSERQVATRTRSVNEGVGSVNAVSGSLSGAASPVPAATAATAAGGAPVGASAAAVPVEPGAPIRVRRSSPVAGEAIRATAPAQPAERPSGPGAPIIIAAAPR